VGGVSPFKTNKLKRTSEHKHDTYVSISAGGSPTC